jgi:hypothetical protein
MAPLLQTRLRLTRFQARSSFGHLNEQRGWGWSVVRWIPIPKLLRPWGWRGYPARRLRVPRIVARGAAVVAAAVVVLLATPGAALADPQITLTIYGTVGSNGWYRSNVTLNWTVSGAENSTGCDAKTLTADTTGTTLTCTASSDAGATVVSKSKTIKLDKTPPAVSAAASRGTDANGWYNHALTVGFAGTDATSGIAACSSGSYAGPDNPSASVSGSCTDFAGNSGAAALSFKYDATPPTVSQVRTKAGNRRIDLIWSASADTQLVQVTRARARTTKTIFTGKAAQYRDRRLKIGALYRYTVTAFDEAGNSASKAIAVTATGPLLSPVPGGRVRSAPLLRWTPVKGARYYNLQLLRGGTRVLSAWPASARFQLRRSWVFNGHRYRLHRGVYRWYVWPGFGKFSASRYGGLLGGSSFVLSG